MCQPVKQNLPLDSETSKSNIEGPITVRNVENEHFVHTTPFVHTNTHEMNGSDTSYAPSQIYSNRIKPEFTCRAGKTHHTVRGTETHVKIPHDEHTMSHMSRVALKLLQ